MDRGNDEQITMFAYRIQFSVDSLLPDRFGLVGAVLVQVRIHDILIGESTIRFNFHFLQRHLQLLVELLQLRIGAGQIIERNSVPRISLVPLLVDLDAFFHVANLCRIVAGNVEPFELAGAILQGHRFFERFFRRFCHGYIVLSNAHLAVSKSEVGIDFNSSLVVWNSRLILKLQVQGMAEAVFL